jgi:tetratricopeptide (TPR) repeat protein
LNDGTKGLIPRIWIHSDAGRGGAGDGLAVTGVDPGDPVDPGAGGSSNVHAVEHEVGELERLAEADHRAAIELGRRILTRLDDPGPRARAHRALGNAHRALAQLDRAFDHYQLGIEVAAEAGLTDIEGLLRMSRAGAYSMAGDRTRALRDLDRAERLTTGGAQARVLFQRAAVIQRYSEGQDALDAYNEVIPLLSRHHDDVILAHALSNRGLIHTYQGNQEAARDDFEAALELYQTHDLPSPAAVVVHNLGMVQTRMHDIPGALARFDEAEERLDALGRPVAGLHVDRAETLLSAGLVDDARSLAEATVAHLDTLGLRTDRAEALLVWAHAALVAGAAEASDLAARAAAEFEAQSRPGWRDRAHVLRLEALVATGAPTQNDERFARRLSRRLSAAGLAGPASRAALVEGLLALRRAGTRAAATSLDRGAYSRRSGLVEDRLAYWALASSLRLADGDRRGAMTAARAGLRTLAIFAGNVDAPDARVGVAIHAERLIDCGLRAAAGSASARTMFEWFERTATAYEVTDRLSTGTEPELRTALDRFRVVVKELTDSGDDPERVHHLRQERRHLEATIKRYSRRSMTTWTLAGTGSPARNAPSAGTTVRRTREALVLAESRRVLVFGDVGGRTLRCERHGSRWARVDLGSTTDLGRRTRSVLTMLRRTAVDPDQRRAARLDRALDDLGRAVVGDLDLGDDDLILVPRGAAALIPWHALPQIARSTLTVSSSLATWARAEGRRTAPDAPQPPSSGAAAHTTIVVGPRLPNAMAEATGIAETLDADGGGSVTVLDPTAATSTAALDALGSSRTVHFVCHGSFRADNPLFSHLELADGPLTVYDIFELTGLVTETVVLSACSGAEVSSRPERAFIGMSGAFLAVGISSLVASVAPVPDAAGTRQLMTAFHRFHQQGLPARHALARGLDTLTDPVDRLLAGPFLTIGAG